MIKIFASALAAAAMLSACATTVNFPVVGKLSNGDAAQGNIVIDLASGMGDIEVYTLKGLSCTGKYSAKTKLPTITIPITCNNGQTGRVIATRDATMVAGTAVAELRNGMTGKFVFGNIDAKMQADFLN